MRSYGGLWETIVSEENLRLAWRRVLRGHAKSVAVCAFADDLEANLTGLRSELVSGRYAPGGYRQFKVHDPKPRTISCAPVRDRIVHHALCAVITPLLERSFVPVSFACREGYGAHAACALARRYVRRGGYFCKMDVRHYFDSVAHEKLLDVLLPRFRESQVRELIAKIVCHPVPGQADGKGLPIGNLTSQWFANAFLDAFDHAALAGFGGKAPCGYLRYMDDVVFFTATKAEAWRLHDAAKAWLADARGLAVKDEATVVAPVSEGVPFLGLRIFPACWRLKRSRFLRTRRTFRSRLRAFLEGRLSGERFAQCAASSDGASRWYGIRGVLVDDLISDDDLVTGEGSASGSNRVNRGGSWNNNATNCTSSNRNNNNPSNENNNNGFRVCSILLQDEGSHPVQPELRRVGDEHARTGRPVAQATAAPCPLTFSAK